MATPVGPAALVDHGVERVAAAEGQRACEVVGEGRRGGVEVQQVVEPLRALGGAEHVAEPAQPLHADPLPVREAQPPGVGRVGEAAEAVTVGGEPRPVLLAAGDHRPPGGGVDVVHVGADRRQPSCEQRLVDAAGGGAEVAQSGEPAEGLPQQRPAPHAEVLAQQLGVGHDCIGPEVGEVPRLLGGGGLAQGGGAGDRALGHRGVGADGRGAAGAALVQHHHAVLAQCTAEPSRGGGLERAGCLGAGAALQEDEVGTIFAAVGGDDTGEHLDLGAGGVGVIERGGEGQIPQLQSGQGPGSRGGHSAHS